MSTDNSQHGTRSRDYVLYEDAEASMVGASGLVTRYPARVVGRQVTFDEKTLFNQSRRLVKKIDDPDRRARLLRQDYGGNFQSTSNDFWASHPGVSLDRNVTGGKLQYGGWLSPVPLNVGPDSTRWPAIPSTLGQTMMSKGATAIARTIPTNPASGVGQALGELRQVPAIPGKALIRSLSKGSSAFQRASEKGRAGADEYLNWEFGIKPVLSDAREFVKAQHNADRIVKQLARDSGRLIRRRFDFPVEHTIENFSLGSFGRHPGFDIRLDESTVNGVPIIRTRETLTRAWFSGAYTYHYSQGETLWKRMMAAEQRANRVYGLRLSPALLWELAPWSWLVDWKSNLGDVITNVSAFSKDGLVLAWGYIMTDMIIVDTYSYTGVGSFYSPTSRDGRTQRSNTRNGVSVSFQTRVKKRLKATPYGFGLDPNWSDLTTRQLSILGALGISRAPR
jgi:hypothetical protein